MIPTLNAGPTLGACLDALRGEADGSLEIVVSDSGSDDGTLAVAEASGALVVQAARGRGTQLAAGAAAARARWLLFLHADTILQPGWYVATQGFISAPENAHRAAYFRFALNDPQPAARRLERLVALRCRILGLPYGDQGLLLARAFYENLGGFRPLPLMEDVDLVRRIGRKRLAPLPLAAITSAGRYREGYLRRSLRNGLCLACWQAGVPAGMIRRLYG